jgi:hypothetical protein
MNIIFYLVGSFITFIGIIVYRFFLNNGSFVLNQNSVTDLAVLSLISGFAFFVTDYLMAKK